MHILFLLGCAVFFPLAAETADSGAPEPLVATPEHALKTARELRQEQPARAVRFYRLAAAAQSADPELRLELADALTAAGQPGEAATEMERVWKLAPTPEVAVRLVDLQLQAAMPVPAALGAEAALTTFPEDSRLVAMTVRALAAVGQVSRAGELAAQLATGEAAGPEARLARARAMLAADRPAAAWQLIADIDLADAVAFRTSLREQALTGPGVLLFPPAGWLPAAVGVTSADGSATVRWQGPLPGDAATVAREHAANGFGKGIAEWLAQAEAPDDDDQNAENASRWEIRHLDDNAVAAALTLSLPGAENAESTLLSSGAVAVPVPAGVAVLNIEPPMPPDELWVVVKQLTGRIVTRPGGQK